MIRMSNKTSVEILEEIGFTKKELHRLEKLYSDVLKSEGVK